jgi:alpha-tubulin suppressor-like RCC1 family protein
MQIYALRHIQKKVALLTAVVLSFSIFTAVEASAQGAGPTFKYLTAGADFNCGLTAAGEVYCWGDNARSQLGTSALNANSTPNKVYGLSTSTGIAAGDEFACAVVSDGGVACWGRGDLGQTGDGILTDVDRLFATRVHGINTAIGVTAGSGHACALLKNGSVFCWGRNELGQLGSRANKFERMPIRVEGIPTIKQLNAGTEHTCALAENGFVYCWGDNKYGQLGIGLTQVLTNTPSLVLGIQKIEWIAIGFNTSCAYRTASGIWCWGWGADGQAGQLDRTNRWLPELISTVLTTTATSNSLATGLAIPSIDFAQISIGKYNVCGVTNSLKGNVLYCWGTTKATDPGVATSTVFPTAAHVSLGSGHGCTITLTGTVSCWGWNHKGQTGLGTSANSFSPLTMVSGFPDWLHWITSWKVAFENNLGTLSWTGGTGNYLVSIQGLGILCENRSALSCTFGPLESNRKYVGTITARNLNVSFNRTANIEFTTGSLTSEYQSYLIELEKAEKLKKAELFLESIKTQIETASKLESAAITQLLDENLLNTKKIEEMASNDLKIAESQKEIKKILLTMQNLVAKIIKKIGG